MSNENKFTPGPWSVEDPMGPDIISIVANAGAPVYEWQFIAQLSSDHPEEERDIPRLQQAANARLIAAAPDLLEALKQARHCIYGGGFQIGWSIDRIDEVIKSVAA